MKDIKIIFEDENILVLNKPAGIIVHSDGKSEEFSVVDFLLKKFPKIKNIGEPLVLSSGKKIFRPGIVHRIDKETSGALLVAKTQEAYLYLKEQFKKREIKKTYHAFVYGALKNERGIIDKPIGRSSSDIRKWTSSKDARGELREAVTKFKVIKETRDNSFLEVWPLTGRTHQIRVHLNSIHHPIICDTLYSKNKLPMLGFKRLALHASKLIFKDLQGNEKEIIVPFPNDFKKAFKEFDIKLESI